MNSAVCQGNRPFNVVLISTYELGRQPFGLASPAAWLERAGARVRCLDLSCQPLEEATIREADFIGLYVPMHTATRLALELLPRLRRLNPEAHLGFYGLYAPVNEAYLRGLGAEIIVGGEFEEGLVRAVERLRSGEAGGEPRFEPVVSLARQRFLVPARSGLPPLEHYARLNHPAGQRTTVGYTEASRGCKHRCRHCPIVPVYGGVFRVVQAEVVLADIRQQVAAGAGHITFGDPDFFNGIGHALRLVTAVHAEFPRLTYDVTIKIEHLLEHAEHLATLRETGCLFVTSAVEAVDDTILRRLDKGHTAADFVRVVELFRRLGLVLSPTFVPFTPWTTLEGYVELLRCLQDLELVDCVAPVQLAIRLLIPAGSRLLELDDVRRLAGPFDAAQLVYPWRHPDPRLDDLAAEVGRLVARAQRAGESRREIFRQVARLAQARSEAPLPGIRGEPVRVDRAAIPYLTEPWYC